MLIVIILFNMSNYTCQMLLYEYKDIFINTKTNN